MKKLSNQRDVDSLIGKSLRIGVIVASIITVFGGIVYLFQHPGPIPNYKSVPGNHNAFIGASDYLREFPSILSHAFQFDGAAIIQLGSIALIATPILRVVLSLFSFAIEKDRLYVGITFIVLMIILINMFFGLH